jgi:hypothetical protein
MLGTILVIAGLLAIGGILGGYVVWTHYRESPTKDQLRLANFVYQKKSDDYKALCHDARTQAETLALLAQTIHQKNPSEASAKIVAELDFFINKMNERLTAKQFTPASGEEIC